MILMKALFAIAPESSSLNLIDTFCAPTIYENGEIVALTKGLGLSVNEIPVVWLKIGVPDGVFSTKLQEPPRKVDKGF